MIYLIVGHRGVGKTLWLKKIKRIFEDIPSLDFKNKKVCFIDLDEKIEKKTGKKIDELLSGKNTDDRFSHKQEDVSRIQEQEKRENYFRLVEKDVFITLFNKYKRTDDLVFISVGAGFKWPAGEEIPSCCHIIHLIRETDLKGRVFLDRPRLKPNESPYEEYMSLSVEREGFYKKIRNESFVLPEQDFDFTEPEKYLFSLKKDKCLNAIITLNKYNLPSRFEHWENFINKRLSWGIRFFEMRDDQLSDRELNFLLEIIPREKRLLSFRKPQDSFFMEKDLSSLMWDWPLEKGPPPSFSPIVSLHERKEETFDQLCKSILECKAGHFKMAVPINNFEELMQGHMWFLEDPEHRSFLPMSGQGRAGAGLWRWYRQIFGPQMKMHFIRESQEGVSDQPFLYEHLLSLSNSKKKGPVSFAAVLGDPVAHSASPSFHRNFFSSQNMLFTKMVMNEEDFTKDNLCILQRLGLVFASVTSPLKKKAFQISDTVDSYAKEVQSVNTMVFHNQKWHGSNTDGYGLKALLANAGLHSFELEKDQTPVAVWGGGGTKKVLEKEISYANFYSARTGGMKSQIKNSKGLEMDIRVVIWAVGRTRMSSCVFPPSSWKPQLVLDLNYTDDSPGLEYALLVGADYMSGKLMFEYQAKKQQEFFSKIKQYNDVESMKNGVQVYGS